MGGSIIPAWLFANGYRPIQQEWGNSLGELCIPTQIAAPHGMARTSQARPAVGRLHATPAWGWRCSEEAWFKRPCPALISVCLKGGRWLKLTESAFKTMSQNTRTNVIPEPVREKPEVNNQKRGRHRRQFTGPLKGVIRKLAVHRKTILIVIGFSKLIIEIVRLFKRD